MWRNSTLCKVSGTLAALSAEASVFFLLLLTFDLLKLSYAGKELSIVTSIIASIASWCLSVCMAGLPILISGRYTENVYTKSGVCFTLPITPDRTQYSSYPVIVFVCFNSFAFLLIGVCQWRIGKKISESTRTNGRNQGTVDINMLRAARTFLPVAITNFICWISIGVMGVLALSGYEISSDVYAWTLLFLLPVNAALNPVLDTASAFLGRKNVYSKTDRADTEDVEYGGVQSILRFWEYSCFIRDAKHLGKARPVAAVNRTRVFSPRDALQIAHQLAQCVYRLHRHQLVHGHMTADNVMLDDVSNKQPRFEVKLLLSPRVCKGVEQKQKDVLDMGLVLQQIVRNTHSKSRD